MTEKLENKSRVSIDMLIEVMSRKLGTFSVNQVHRLLSAQLIDVCDGSVRAWLGTLTKHGVIEKTTGKNKYVLFSFKVGVTSRFKAYLEVKEAELKYNILHPKSIKKAIVTESNAEGKGCWRRGMVGKPGTTITRKAAE